MHKLYGCEYFVVTNQWHTLHLGLRFFFFYIMHEANKFVLAIRFSPTKSIFYDYFVNSSQFIKYKSEISETKRQDRQGHSLDLHS